MTSAVDERPPSDEETALEDRYGTRRRESRGRRGVRAGIAVGAALTVATVAFWGVAQAQMGPEATMSTGVVNFRVPDASSIEADITITVQPGTPLACAIEATNAQHLVVGWDIIDVPPIDGPSQLVTATIRTTQAASTVVVKSCWVP